MTRNLVHYIASFSIFMVLQLLVFNHLEILNIGFCFIYLGFLLMLPHDLNSLSGLAIGFINGLIIDLFYNSGGIHTAACVLIMFLRPYFLRIVNPKSGFDIGMRMTIGQFGWGWYSLYTGVLIFIHHLVVFSLDAFNPGMVLEILNKSLFSSLFTYIMVLSVQMLVFGRDKS